MKRNDLQRMLDTLHWRGATLAAVLQCDESLVRKWLTGKLTVPPPVAHWLAQLVAAHERHPVPAWRGEWQFVRPKAA